jgi:hypothetical protein
VMAKDIFAALDGKEPGALAGPLSDMMGSPYFFELIERTPPTDDDKAKIVSDAKDKHKQRIQMAQMGLVEDFRKETREQILRQVSYTQYDDVIDQMLGKNHKQDQAATDDAAKDGAAKEGDAAKTETPAPSK